MEPLVTYTLRFWRGKSFHFSFETSESTEVQQMWRCYWYQVKGGIWYTCYGLLLAIQSKWWSVCDTESGHPTIKHPKYKSFQSRIVTVMLFIEKIISLILTSVTFSYIGVCSVNAESSLLPGNIDFSKFWSFWPLIILLIEQRCPEMCKWDNQCSW